MARVLYLIHEPHWTESRIADSLRAAGHAVEFRCPPAGDSLPESAQEFDGIVVGGHSLSPYQADLHPHLGGEVALAGDAAAHDVPYLGICFGAQALAAAFGAGCAAHPGGLVEFGFHRIHPTADGRELFGDLDHVFQSHYEGIAPLPSTAVLLAVSDHFPVQAFRFGRRAYGFQFHPDARLDMIDGWWSGNPHLHDRVGAHDLARQRADALRFEDATQRWLDRFLHGWLTG